MVIAPARHGAGGGGAPAQLHAGRQRNVSWPPGLEERRAPTAPRAGYPDVDPPPPWRAGVISCVWQLFVAFFSFYFGAAAFFVAFLRWF